MPEIKVFHAGDILNMKKPHACSKAAGRFLVLYAGSDVKVKCLSCGREMLLARVKLEKNIKSIVPKETNCPEHRKGEK